MINKQKVEKIRDEIECHSVDCSHFRGRKLITISSKDFGKLREHFSRGINIGSKINYRSHHTWKHIHAIQDGKIVQAHIDHGNPYKNILFAFPHFFIDVVPYFLRHLLTLQKPYTF